MDTISLKKEIVEDLVDFKLQFITNEIDQILAKSNKTSVDQFLNDARAGILEESETDAIDLRNLTNQLVELHKLKAILTTSMDDNPREMSLQVAEINEASAKRALCVAGTHVARQLNLKAGEIVAISGKKTTGCIFFPEFEDEGQQLVRVDGVIRLNAGAELGEIVRIRKAKPMPAKRVVIAQVGTSMQLQPRKIRDSLMNRPVMKGDNITIINMAIPIEESKIQSGNDGVENMQNNSTQSGGRRKRTYTLGELRLVVLETLPKKSIVQITAATNVEIWEV